MRTSDLTGVALDWAVAKCEGFLCDYKYNGALASYSTDWSQGGPIIEREDINVTRFTYSEITESGAEIYRKEGWMAFTTTSSYWMTPKRTYGPTPLIAAMRCYVASNLGDEVDIPEELT